MAGSMLNEPVETLAGIGPKRAAVLSAINVRQVRDLLLYLPRDYQDRRHFTSVQDAREGDTITVCVEVVRASRMRLRRNLSATEAVLRDGTGGIKAVWFGRDYLAQSLPAGTKAVFSGSVSKWNGLALRNPEYEILTGDEDDLLNTGRIVPVYRLSSGITQRMLRRWISTALEATTEAFRETLPDHLRQKHSFPGIREAIESVHFPESIEAARAARGRFAYEELLSLQVGILRERARRLHEERGTVHATSGPNLNRFRAELPFELTRGQQEAVAAVLKDMASPRPMVRLIQGDVGCGKTVVAVCALAAAVDGGYQAALMAPTEILAEQHAAVLREWLTPLGLRVEALTGSSQAGKEIREAIASGGVHVVAGTHALIQESVAFHRLGLVIIDEQHRFGVVQRDMLAQKGTAPDVIHMSATPIPRTLALTVYGSMDLSVISDMPPGRLPVKTRRILPSKEEDMYRYIVKQVKEGYQAYIICPLVEESEKRALTAVTTHFEQLREGPLKDLRLALLHGRLAPREKDAVMQAFKEGSIDVLCSTTVIEVGVDCPNATAMVIVDAGQFGLTQLHQLRGRVGRGREQAHCFLAGKAKTKDGMARIKALCDLSSGFDIAEADLEMRGPGELLGTRQAGLSDLRVADLIRDVRLLDAARKDAEEILEQDPALALPAHAIFAKRARLLENVVA